MDIILRSASLMYLCLAIKVDHEVFSAYGTSEEPEIFAKRLLAFPEGLIIAKCNGKMVGYGTSERWLTEREPMMNEDPLLTHHPEGKIFCITGMAGPQVLQGQGIGSALLVRLVSVASAMGCEKIILETTHAQDFYLRNGLHVVREKEQWDVRLTIMKLNLQKASRLQEHDAQIF